MLLVKRQNGYGRLLLIMGILLLCSLCVRGQNLEISKNWLKEDRKLRLKTDAVMETEYLKIEPDRNKYSSSKTLYEIGSEKYSVDYLNKSVKEELKYMSVSPLTVSEGVGGAVGGLNLSNPKAWFTVAKHKKRRRKMQQITNYVYPLD